MLVKVQLGVEKPKQNKRRGKKKEMGEEAKHSSIAEGSVSESEGIESEIFVEAEREMNDDNDDLSQENRYERS